ncbi:MAG TPA: DUF58 domain-containing protein [Chloroflexota bacterium]|jgi:uncharacterized protein (DUF58 family)|nr:DUF58 domain-containing protein [Chloroflexota bacterium]
MMRTSTWQDALRRTFARRGRADRPGASEAADVGPLLDEDALRQLNQLSLVSGNAITDWLLGEHSGRRKTQALEFEDYRGYVPGDDYRLIDWNAYARLGELFVKTSQTEESITLSLLLDCSRSMDWGHPNKLRYSKRLVALLGALALLQSDEVRLYALGDGAARPGAPLSGAGALQVLVDELEAMPVAATTDLRASLTAVREPADLRGVLVLVSDLLVPADQEDALGMLSAEGISASVLHIVDPAEALPDLDGALDLRDSESGAQLPITLTPALRRRYRERFEARAQAVAAFCASQDIHYIRVSTDVPPADLLAGAFLDEGVVQA